MYKKKLGVRVITAITVGALLSSNMSVAMANTQIATLEDNLDEKTADEEKNVEEEETETVDETVEETETEETEEEESTDEIEESDSEKEVTGDEEDTVETEEEETPVEEKTEEETDKEEEAPAETDDPSGASDDAEELPAEETEEETDTAEEGVPEENTDAKEEVSAKDENLNEEIDSEMEKENSGSTNFIQKSSLNYREITNRSAEEITVTIAILDENLDEIGRETVEVAAESGLSVKTNQEWLDISGIDIEGYELDSPNASYTASDGDEVSLYVTKKEEEPEQKITVTIAILDENLDEIGRKTVEVAAESGLSVKTNQEWLDISGIDIEGYELDSPNASYTASDGDEVSLYVTKKEDPDTDIIMNVQFYEDTEDNVIAGGDYFVPAGVQNYSVLDQYVPEGYKIAVSGDFFAEEGATLKVRVEKDETEEPTEDIIMNIQFYEDTEDNVIAGGDYFVPAGIQNYSVLDKYAPVGYKIAVTGDFLAEEGAELKVRVEKIQPTIINVVFTDAQGNNVGGGDYFVDEDGDGIFNYSELDVPEGYKLVETGDAFVSDFVGKTTELKVVRDGAAIINVTFTDAQGNNVGGGDYFVDEDGDGIFNYSELDVPEGYKLVVTGDAFVNDFVGKTTELKVVRDGAAIINAQFVDEDGNVIAGGDYFVDEDGDGIFNYSELAEYVPEGYTMQTLGDAFVAEGTFIINISKDNEEPETKNVTITYVDENGKIVGTQTIEVPAGDNNINTSKLTVPEGFELVWTGDLAIEDGAVTVEVKATENPDNPDNPDPEDPDNPDNPDPEDPDNPDNPDNPDPDQPDNPNQGGSGSGSSGGSSGGSGGGSGSATGSHALKSGEWILDDIGWWYQYSDNTYAKAGWYSLVWRGNTDWYYFNEAGYLISGWFEQNGNRYFLHDVHDGTFGRMYTGWNQVEGQWYFFNDNADNGTVGALVERAQVPAELLNQ